MTPKVDELMRMPQSELDALFGRLEPGPVPDGEAAGTAIVAPGTPFSPAIAEAINLFAWQGKVFDAASMTLRNHILPFGMRAVLARIEHQASWLDTKPCIVLDYAQTSVVAQRIRDEIRLLGDALYLGKVYWGHDRLFDFTLQFATAS